MKSILLLVALCGCQMTRPTMHTATSRSNISAPSEMRIDIPVPPMNAPNGADLYSALDPAGPWIYRTDDLMVTNINEAIIWRVPHTPEATKEFYLIVPATVTNVQ